MARTGRGEPTEEVIDRIFNAVNCLLPWGMEAAVLRGLNERIANAIVAREDSVSSVPLYSDSESVPVLQETLGSRASSRVSLHQQQGKQEKRVNKEVYDYQAFRCHVPGHRHGARKHRPIVSREAYDSQEEFSTSSDESVDSDAARTPPPPPRHIDGPAQQRQRNLSSHMVRSSTVPEPSAILSRDTSVSIQTAKPASQGTDTRRDMRGRMIFQCSKCPQTKHDRMAFEAHVVGHGAPGKFSCMDCDFATASIQSYNWHLKLHLEPSQPEKNGLGKKRRSPSESEPDESPVRMSSPKRRRHNGHSAIPRASRSGRCSATNYRSAAERVKHAHLFSPGQSTSGCSSLRAESETERVVEFRCSDCPEVFFFNSNLKLHRRQKHPRRNVFGRRAD